MKLIFERKVTPQPPEGGMREQMLIIMHSKSPLGDLGVKLGDFASLRSKIFSSCFCV